MAESGAIIARSPDYCGLAVTSCRPVLKPDEKKAPSSKQQPRKKRLEVLANAFRQAVASGSWNEVVGSMDRDSEASRICVYARTRRGRRVRLRIVLSIFGVAILLVPSLYCSSESTAQGNSSFAPGAEDVVDTSANTTSIERAPLTDGNSSDWTPYMRTGPPLNELEWLDGSVKTSQTPGPEPSSNSVIPWTKASLVESDTSYTYYTAFGIYSFLKSCPLVLDFSGSQYDTYSCKAGLLPYSSRPFALENFDVLATDTLYEATVSMRGQIGLAAIADLKVDFLNKSGPKFSLELFPACGVDATTLWIQWDIVSLQASCDFLSGENVMPDGSMSLSYLGSDQAWAALCDDTEGGARIQKAIVSWQGSRPESVVKGRINASGILQGDGLSVIYPYGSLYVDPSLVGSSLTYWTSHSGKHNVFFADDRYFVFYLYDSGSGCHIHYSCSKDLGKWDGPHSTPIKPVISYDGVFDIAVLGKTVLISSFFQSPTESLRLRIWTGTVNQSLIQDWKYADLTANLNTLADIHLGSCAINEEGFWASFAINEPDRGYDCWRVVRNNGNFSHVTYDSFDFIPDQREIATDCILVPRASGRLTAILVGKYEFNQTTYPKILWAEYNPWQRDDYLSSNFWEDCWPRTSSTFNGVLSDSSQISAVATTNDVVHIVYRSSKGIEYARIFGDLDSGRTMQSVQTVGTTASCWPAISRDPLDCIHLFFRTGGNSVQYAHAEFMGESCQFVWSSFSNPIEAFVESQGTLSWLVSSSTAFANAVATWFVTTGSGIGSVKIGALPIQGVLQRYGGNSDPWNRIGMTANQPFNSELDAAVSPGSGLLYVQQTDMSMPGRLGMDLQIARIYKTDPAYLAGQSYCPAECRAYAIAAGWSFDFPYLRDPFVHLSGGQEYLICWDGNVFENHAGEHFKLVRTPNGTSYSYTLYSRDGTRYDFSTDGTLRAITDRTGLASITFQYATIGGVKRISRIVDSLGLYSDFSYASNFTLSSVLYRGRQISYSVRSTDNLLLAVTDELGRKINFSYAVGLPRLLTRTTYLTQGYFTVAYGNFTAGTDVKKYVVTSLRLYSTSRTGYLYRERASYFNYETYAGRIIFTNTTLYGSSDSSYKGKVTLTYGSATRGMLQRIYDSSGVAMRTIRTWYGLEGDVQSQDLYQGTNSTPTSTVGVTDDWGNLIYSRDPIGHENFFSYLNTSTQNSFRSASLLQQRQSGKICQTNFDTRTLEGWSILSPSQYQFDNDIAPWQAPTLRLNGTMASASLDFGDMITSSWFLIDIGVTSGQTSPVLWLYSDADASNGVLVKFATDGRIYVSTYANGPTNPTYVQVMTYEVNRLYEIGIRIVNSDPSRRLFDFYLDGRQYGTSLTYGGSAPLSACKVTAFNYVSTTAWVDDVRVFKSGWVIIDGISGYKAVLTAVDGELLACKKADPSSGRATLLIGNWYSKIPSLTLSVDDFSGRVVSEYLQREIWGGDVYAFSPTFNESSFVKVQNGFANWNLVSPFIDESYPGRMEPSQAFTYPAFSGSREGGWVIDGDNASSGEWYHVSELMAGTHYHGYNATSSLAVSQDSYVLQYVRLDPWTMPNQLMIGFRTLDGSTYKDLGRVFWGNQIMDLTAAAPELRKGSLSSAEPDKWLVFCARGQDFGIVGNKDTRGMTFALHGGNASWDASVVTLDDRIASVFLRGLSSGDKVQLNVEGHAPSPLMAPVLADGTYRVTFNLLTDVGVTIFPCEISFVVYRNGKVMESPWFEVYGGDGFEYRSSDFKMQTDLWQNSCTGQMHSLLAGSLEYQNGSSDPNSLKIRYTVEYDAMGRAKTVQMLHNRTWKTAASYSYDTTYGNLVSSTDSVGVTATYLYDATYHAYVESVIQGGLTTSMSYDYVKGRLTSTTGPGSDRPTTRYEYDSIDRVTKETLPAVNGVSEVINSYYADSQRLVEVCDLVMRQDYYYDSLGRLECLKEYDFSNPPQLLQAVYWDHGWDGNIVNESWLRGSTTTYEYDSLGRMTKQTQNHGPVVRTTYDDSKRSWQATDSCNHSVSYYSDLAGRVTSYRELYKYGSNSYNETRYGYDNTGNLIYMRDAKG